MKNTLTLIAFGILLSCASTKTGVGKTRYFDENNVEITKSKFKEIRSTNVFLDIPGDSVNHIKLTTRERRGSINDRAKFESFLENELKLELPSDKPIVIIYYPGKDPCNTSGMADAKSRERWYGELEEGLRQVAQVKPLYIYKDNEGLERYPEILDWRKDPDGVVERLFFEHHYPCSSFTVISKNGDYISYFGEFGKGIVWEATQIMNN